MDRRLSKRGRLEGRPSDGRVVTERFKVTPEEAAEIKRRSVEASESKSRYLRRRALSD